MSQRLKRGSQFPTRTTLPEGERERLVIGTRDVLARHLRELAASVHNESTDCVAKSNLEQDCNCEETIMLQCSASVLEATENDSLVERVNTYLVGSSLEIT